MTSASKRGAGIQFIIPAESESADKTTPQHGALPKSGVAMVALGGMASANLRRELDETKKKLQSTKSSLEELHSAGAPPVKVDPRKIRISRWANRHEASFNSAEFIELKEDLRESGGNLVPIKVRPIEDREGFEYELVYGHRRHRACIELGLPVLALVQKIDDKQLFLDMERENGYRVSLSAYEQGAHYLRAVESGLFRSFVGLSSEIGVSIGNISKAVKIAKLPASVVGCFPSPLCITYRMGEALSEALERDPDGVLRRAEELSQLEQRPTEEAILRRLVGDTVKKVTELKIGDRKVGSFQMSKRGDMQVAFKIPGVAEERQPEVLKRIQKLLEELIK